MIVISFFHCHINARYSIIIHDGLSGEMTVSEFLFLIDKSFRNEIRNHTVVGCNCGNNPDSEKRNHQP